MQEYGYPTLASDGRRRANRRLVTALSLICGTTLLMLTCFVIRSAKTDAAPAAIAITVEQRQQLDIPPPAPPVGIEQSGAQPPPLQTTEQVGIQPPSPQPTEQPQAEAPKPAETDIIR